MSSQDGREVSRRKQKRILLIGDWVVNDHWVTTIHRSPTSSRTGAQYRAIPTLDSTTQELSAAGRVARVLHRASIGNTTRFCDVLGVGLWHPEDTKILTEMLEPRANQGQTPHQLKRHPGPNLECGCELFNLAELPKGRSGSKVDCPGTTHMFRVYQQSGPKINLFQRIDWELPARYIPQAQRLKDLEQRITAKNGIDAVVIKDVLKGAVTKKLIKWLASGPGKGVPWYVSTKGYASGKASEPEWLSEIEKLRLLLIPKVAAESAVAGGLNCWIPATGEPRVSRSALREIDRLGERFESLIVVLPDSLNLVARDFRRDRVPDGILLQTELPQFADLLPMASVFFPAFIMSDLAHGVSTDPQKLLLEQFEQSLAFTRAWMTNEFDRIKNVEGWQAETEPCFKATNPNAECQTLDQKRSEEKTVKASFFDWKTAEDQWTKAFHNIGVIEVSEGKRIIEPERAMTEIKNYICCVKSKRKAVLQLVNEINSFAKHPPEHQQSYMLIADPGSGKTYLVKCLAKAANLSLRDFNIAQMLSKNDVLDCFDTIVTTQAFEKKPVLAFFDEINAKIEGEHVYDLFLAPIEDSCYVRGGKTFHLKPCIWIFAGTERPVLGKPDRDKETKALDFESRLTFPEPLSLAIDESNSEQVAELRLERVYVGVTHIKRYFPDVKWVCEDVLKLFHSLPPDLSVRDLDHLVRSFVNVQFGLIKNENIPHEWLKRLKVDPDIWRNGVTGCGMVEIK